MGAKDIKKYQWRKGQSGNPKGLHRRNRFLQQWKPLLIEQTIADFCPDITEKERRRAIRKAEEQTEPMNKSELSHWRQYLIAATKQQLTTLVKHADDYPVFAVGKSLGILYDMKNGKTTTIDRLTEEEYGKPQDTLSIVDNRSRFDEMSDEELAAEVERLDRAMDVREDED